MQFRTHVYTLGKLTSKSAKECRSLAKYLWNEGGRSPQEESGTAASPLQSSHHEPTPFTFDASRPQESERAREVPKPTVPPEGYERRPKPSSVPAASPTPIQQTAYRRTGVFVARAVWTERRSFFSFQADSWGWMRPLPTRLCATQGPHFRTPPESITRGPGKKVFGPPWSD